MNSTGMWNHKSIRHMGSVLLLSFLTSLAACADKEKSVDVGGASGTAGGTDIAELARYGYKIGKPYQIKGVWYYPEEDFHYDRSGIASWYGPGFHGENTANGEIYDQNAMTAAHTTLPLPTLVRVTNLDNGRQVVVRVNDRGPFVDNRIIDLSRKAAQMLDIEKRGIANVRVQVLTQESRQLAARLSGKSTATQFASETGAAATSAKTIQTAENPPSAASKVYDPEAIRKNYAKAGYGDRPSARGAHALAAANGAGYPSSRASVVPFGGNSVKPGNAIQAAAYQPDQNSAQIQQTRVPVTFQPQHNPSLPLLSGSYFVQLGSFTDAENAERYAADMGFYGPVKTRPAIVNGQQFFRVMLGPWANRSDADLALSQVMDSGHPGARVVIE